MDKNYKIKVGIIGTGNCAKSLVEGIQYYVENPEDKVGLMYEDIGGYTINNIEFVIGFDIDSRKVNKPLAVALRAAPNCAMDHVKEIDNTCIPEGAMVYCSPEFDGVAPHMLQYPEEVSFRISKEPAKSADEIISLLKSAKVEILINYLPVGSEDATRFWIDIAIKAGIHFVNCIPTIIATKETQVVEQRFIDAGLSIVGSDMRSAWGSSRMSEVLQGAMLDSGLMITQHIQMNMAAGSTQGHEHFRTGRTANTDFLNMAKEARLENKHISKENVLKGQNSVRNESISGMTLFAGPSLTVQQKPGGQYIGSDNKIANFDIVAYGFGGARYEFSGRLSVQDSPNSGGVVVSAIRFCKVASEMGIVGFLRGPSAWTQKTPPLQLKTEDAKFECDALARRELTKLTSPQLKEKKPKAKDLPYTFQDDKNDYQ
ncbi:MAG TPA: Myo-inositol-1-phosphate synthase [Spirochaetota bacterium]|nr:Myo-inositol-1-phosphate synthase [Spirochaetota bacterium]HPS87641.1 Myo-inositol-1-phosphate synthase [Spirochaetota bacterium]